jgi:2-methylcitrate dehydratase PrpD
MTVTDREAPAGTTVSPTEELARFASVLEFDDIPSGVVEHVKICVLDDIGCALFATRLPWCQIVVDYISEVAAAGDSTVWGTDLRVAPDAAALANSTAGHGFELDDIHPAGMHPGPLAIPAAMALGESLNADGRELITSIVAGNEVGTRVGTSVAHGHLKAGFHAQGTVGVFVAAAAAGRMLKLTAPEMRNALGIAGSLASGLIAAQEGAMTKRLHSGTAAKNGVMAAQLAQRGFTGIQDVFENPFGGFCKTMGGGLEDLAALTSGLGEIWETSNIGFKIYASCGSTHSALGVAQRLRSDARFDPRKVTAVTVYASSHAVLHVGWPYVPNGVTAAQMNLPFVMALMLLYGEVGFDRLTEEGIRDPKTIGLANRIQMLADEEIDALGRPGRHGARVVIELDDDTKIEGSTSYRPGSPQDPVDVSVIRAKYEMLTREVVPTEQSERIADLVSRLDEVDVRSLARTLRIG